MRVVLAAGLFMIVSFLTDTAISATAIFGLGYFDPKFGRAPEAFLVGFELSAVLVVSLSVIFVGCLPFLRRTWRHFSTGSMAWWGSLSGFLVIASLAFLSLILPISESILLMAMGSLARFAIVVVSIVSSLRLVAGTRVGAGDVT